jgi:hypothetical protein
VAKAGSRTLCCDAHRGAILQAAVASASTACLHREPDYAFACSEPTKIMERREPRVWMMSGKDKAKRRSITPQGIARAMADQWSVL